MAINVTLSHPNNPASPRYWKNIIPDYLGVDNRAGINALTEIGDSEFLDIIFGFGNIYDGNFNIGGLSFLPCLIEVL